MVVLFVGKSAEAKVILWESLWFGLFDLHSYLLKYLWVKYLKVESRRS